MDLLVLVSVMSSEKDVVHQGCSGVLAFLGKAVSVLPWQMA